MTRWKRSPRAPSRWSPTNSPNSAWRQVCWWRQAWGWSGCLYWQRSRWRRRFFASTTSNYSRTALRSDLGAGLLTRKEIVVECAKVQQLRVDQGVVMRLLQRCRLRMLPATSGAASGNSTPVSTQTLHVPLLDLELLGDLQRRVFGDEGTFLQLHPGWDGFIAISPLYIRARLLAVGVLPATLVAGALVPLVGLGALLALAWPLLVGLVAWQTWRRRGYRYDDDGLVSRTGLIGFSIDAFLFRKVQGATVSRSPLQRRNDLASLTVQLASGHVTVPYIDYATACRLRDYMLFKVESSRLPWH